jgi:hypothetical protein
LRSSRVRYAVIGGVAVGFHGRPRLTRDVDAIVLLPEARWTEFLSSARAAGFASRVAHAEQFARSSRLFLLRHRATGTPVDLAIASIPFDEEVVARAVSYSAGRLRVPVASLEDLFVTKLVAGRPVDMGDLDELLAANPRIDLSRVRAYARAFAALLDDSQMLETLEKLVSRAATPPSGPRTRAARRSRGARRGSSSGRPAASRRRAGRG